MNEIREVENCRIIFTPSLNGENQYAATSLSLKAHPVSSIRKKLDQLHVLSAQQLSSLKDGDRVKVAGLVLVRQRRGTAGGICFMTIDDETGFANAGSFMCFNVSLSFFVKILLSISDSILM